MSNGTHSATWRWTLVAALPALVLAAWQAAMPWPFFSDDSFISLRFTQRLLEGHGLTWTHEGSGQLEYVEGYSNLLWVLLTACLGAIGFELVTAARLLGALCTAGALLLLARAFRPHDLRSAITGMAMPLLVAASQPVLVWTLGGLEGPLLLLLLAWGFTGLLRFTNSDEPAPLTSAALIGCGVPFALACWTRPDGPLWVLTAGVGLGALGLRAGLKGAVRSAFFFGLPAMLAVVAQLAFRLLYYGDYVPNTAHVKAELDSASFAPGWKFVTEAAISMPGMMLAAALGLVAVLAQRQTRAFAWTLALPIVAWFAYLTAIGGDHFPGLRLLHGVLVPLTLLAGLGVHSLRAPIARVVAGALVVLVAAPTDAYHSRTNPRSLEACDEVWEWRGKVVGEQLARSFAERQPRIAVDAAGALPYYSKLPALDMLGLCDRTIATTPFPAWLDTVRPGTPKPPGHLRGNGSYVMDAMPDLLMFSNPPGLPLPVFVSACEFEDDPRFLSDYRLVMADLGTHEQLPGNGKQVKASLWVRSNGRAGVNRNGDRIEVPAWLFGSLALPGPVTLRHQPPGPDLKNLAVVGQFYEVMPCAAVPTTGGELALRSRLPTAVTFELHLDAGRWQTRVEPAGCGATTEPELTVERPGKVTLQLNCPADARPTRVILQRAP